MVEVYRGSHWRVGRIAAPALLLAGCTIFAPVQTPEDDRRFPVSFPTTEAVPCVDSSGTGTQCSASIQTSLDDFHAGLGRAMWEMDIRRRQLVGQAAQHTNINSTYNALLWPIGAFFIAKKIHDPTWSTLDTVAVATATYGLLGSGIPDRDKLYLKTSARMVCTMVEFDAELYTEAEIAGTGLSTIPPQKEFSLGEALDDLIQAKEDFIARRDELATKVELQSPGKALVGSSANDKLRLEAIGKSKTPAALKDPTPDLFFVADKILASADQQLTDGLKLKRQLDSSGTRLRQQRTRIEAALTQALNDRTPALVSPLDRAREIAQAYEDGMTAEKNFTARIKKESGAGREDPWQPTTARLKGLTPASRALVISFWINERANLIAAQQRVSSWSLRHAERVRIAKADATSMGCNDGDLSEFLKKLSAAAATPNPPTTPASGGGK